MYNFYTHFLHLSIILFRGATAPLAPLVPTPMLYKDEVSSLVHILQLVASYHEVLESLTSDSSLEVSEELPESVSMNHH